MVEKVWSVKDFMGIGEVGFTENENIIGKKYMRHWRGIGCDFGSNYFALCFFFIKQVCEDFHTYDK